MQNSVKIVSEQDAGYFVGNGTSGALTGYTLRRGNENVIVFHFSYSCFSVLKKTTRWLARGIPEKSKRKFRAYLLTSVD